MRLRLLLLSFFPLLALASPVRSNMGGDELSHLNPDDGPQNLWVWPTGVESPRRYRSPSTIWTPEIGVWYYRCATNGYIQPSGSFLSDYGNDFVTTTYSGGYSAGTFVYLDAGHYHLSCNVDAPALFRLGFYKEVDGGYLWSAWTTITSQPSAGRYERVFTVPDECSLVLLLPCSYITDPLTVTDIEIYRLD